MKKFYIVLILISFVLSINVHMKAYASSEIEGCSIFPDDNIWNTPVDKLPVDPNSSTYINAIGAAVGLHPDFGSGNWNGGPIGIPYTVVSVMCVHFDGVVGICRKSLFNSL